MLMATICAWSMSPLAVPARPCSCLRANIVLQLSEQPDASQTGAATGEDVPKTDGIPNYMIRTSGTLKRIAEAPDSDASVQDDGVRYDADRIVSIITSDVIDMIQQQGGSAEKVDFLGENMLVEGLLFDDFRAEDTFDIFSSDAAEGDEPIISVQIIEARSSSALELSQIDDDDAMQQSVTSLTSLAPGFAGWSARVIAAGQVRAGFKISKRTS